MSVLVCLVSLLISSKCEAMELWVSRDDSLYLPSSPMEICETSESLDPVSLPSLPLDMLHYTASFLSFESFMSLRATNRALKVQIEKYAPWRAMQGARAELQGNLASDQDYYGGVKILQSYLSQLRSIVKVFPTSWHIPFYTYSHNKALLRLIDFLTSTQALIQDFKRVCLRNTVAKALIGRCKENISATVAPASVPLLPSSLMFDFLLWRALDCIHDEYIQSKQDEFLQALNEYFAGNTDNKGQNIHFNWRETLLYPLIASDKELWKHILLNVGSSTAIKDCLTALITELEERPARDSNDYTDAIYNCDKLLVCSPPGQGVFILATQLKATLLSKQAAVQNFKKTKKIVCQNWDYLQVSYQAATLHPVWK